MGASRARRDRRLARRFVVGLVAWIGLSTGSAAPATSSGPFELRVVVEDRPGLVRVHVLLPEGFPAESINVETAGKDLVVLGRDRDGVSARSGPIRLSHPVSAEGAEARFERDGSLTITLRVVDVGS
jgi:HSP20 family molecular chaperone IbpA